MQLPSQWYAINRYSLPLLNLRGDIPIKSLYAVHSSSLIMTMYATSLVLLLGVDETGKLSSLRYYWRMS